MNKYTRKKQSCFLTCRHLYGLMLAGYLVSASSICAQEQLQKTTPKVNHSDQSTTMAARSNDIPTNDTSSKNSQSNESQAFELFKQGLVKDFQQAKIPEPLIREILNSIHFIPRVIELDRRQPESTMTHEIYLQKVIPEWKVRNARQAWKDNYAQLQKVEKSTGVSSRFIVALWGKESHFGKITGKYHVPSALATLAFEGRRASFFRKELINAARIIAQGHIQTEDMLGSWAGAMGHCQFMPSSFLNFAKDGNGDGKADIWGNKEDVFASIANYLIKSGWDKKGTWGRQVKLTQPFESYSFGKKFRQKLSEWQALGVRRYDLSDLPKANVDAYLVAPGGKKGRIYLVYNNYDVLLKWNRSSFFATGVGYLADRISYPPIDMTRAE